MNEPSSAIRLKPGREKPVIAGHPWVFSGAIDAWRGQPDTGDVVEVFNADGEWIARGLAHPRAGLAVRVCTTRHDTPVDAAYFRARIDRAVALREKLFPPTALARTNAYRLIFSEADGLSGLIVDRYGDTLAVRVGAAALVRHLPVLLDALRDRTGIAKLHVRAEGDDAEREEIDSAALAALSTGSGRTDILQDGYRFEVDLDAGQKTGFYLDQRVNRARIASYAAGARVLSCYCYTGALEAYLGAAGAQSVMAVDSSGPALEIARRHAGLNLCATPIEWVEGDVPATLRKLRDRAMSFDLIVLDPPKFVFSAAQKDKGLRAYKDINLLGLKLLAPGGILATFSCSGLVTRDDLRTTLAWAAKDAGREARIVEQLSQPPDHPTLPQMPETEYLRGFIVAG